MAARSLSISCPFCDSTVRPSVEESADSFEHEGGRDARLTGVGVECGECANAFELYYY